MKKTISTLDNERLVTLENMLGVTLPQDYRDYLLEYNGRGFEKNTFEVFEGEYSIVHHVYRISNDNDYFDLINSYKRGKNIDHEKGRKFLIIADDNVGNDIILSLAADSFGEIYFYDNDTISTKCTKLAQSFSEFCSSLFDLQDISVYENTVDEALDKKDLKLLERALQQGYDVENLDKYSRNLLERSVITGDIDLVSCVLERQPQIRSSMSLAEENYIFFKEEYAPIIDILKKHYKL